MSECHKVQVTMFGNLWHYIGIATMFGNEILQICISCMFYWSIPKNSFHVHGATEIAQFCVFASTFARPSVTITCWRRITIWQFAWWYSHRAVVAILTTLTNDVFNQSEIILDLVKVTYLSIDIWSLALRGYKMWFLVYLLLVNYIRKIDFVNDYPAPMSYWNQSVWTTAWVKLTEKVVHLLCCHLWTSKQFFSPPTEIGDNDTEWHDVYRKAGR